MNREEIINALSKLEQHEGHKGIDFNEWQAINAAIECLRTDGLWHPASEPPKEDGEYVVKKEWGLARADLSYSKFENGKWSTPQVKWWCYPPEE